jgi:hypothetical protein
MCPRWDGDVICFSLNTNNFQNATLTGQNSNPDVVLVVDIRFKKLPRQEFHHCRAACAVSGTGAPNTGPTPFGILRGCVVEGLEETGTVGFHLLLHECENGEHRLRQFLWRGIF